MHVCLYTCIHTYIYVCSQTYIRACMYLHVYLHRNTWVCMYACMEPHKHKNVCIYICLYICMYVYVHACISSLYPCVTIHTFDMCYWNIYNCHIANIHHTAIMLNGHMKPTLLHMCAKTQPTTISSSHVIAMYVTATNMPLQCIIWNLFHVQKWDDYVNV